MSTWSILIEFDLGAASPFSAALLLDDGEALHFGRLPGLGRASDRLAVRLSFRPFAWHTSDNVDVGLYQSDRRAGPASPSAFTILPSSKTLVHSSSSK